MRLLKHYLKAVKMYLPRGEQRNDIIRELSENLLSKMEDREVKLDRPLTELEQETILREHGNPMEVAASYGIPHRSVSFGRQLIGPALYPLYILILWLHFGLALVIHTYLAVFKNMTWSIVSFFFTVIIQFACVTLVFVILDIYHRYSWQFKCFHVEYLHPVSRGHSTVGLIFWVIYSVSWAAIPHFPSLVLGAADGLALAPVWSDFYWPILLLLLAGVAQRIANLIRPDWNWLLPPIRLVINLVSLYMLFFILRGEPYVILANVASATQEAQNMASHISGFIWAFLLCFGFYWVINIAFASWHCVRHLRYRLHRRQKMHVS
jgi:hypothetical protein